jgi:hypothetical protein
MDWIIIVGILVLAYSLDKASNNIIELLAELKDMKEKMGLNQEDITNS